MGIQDCRRSRVINYYHNHLENVQCHWHDVQSYFVEVILTGWVDTAPLDLSELLKSNVDGNLGLGEGPPESSYTL
jgi:hypothetical protein